MARSKNLYFIRKRITIEQPNDPTNTNAHTGEIDIATLLSKQLGRTIKQNQNFRVVGWGAHLGTTAAGDLDLGLAASVNLGFCPTTKFSKKGHKMLQDAYWKQSNFRQGLGVNSRYDEFEVALMEQFSDDRTSTVFVGGKDDPNAETCVLYGLYDDSGSDRKISAEAMINAKNPVKQGGVLIEDDLLFDDEIHYKPAKFDSHFPPMVNLGATATLSSQQFYDHNIGFDTDYPMGAIATDTLHMMEDNHLNVLAGRIYYNTTVLPRDDVSVVADQLFLYITIAVEGWGPLHYRPKKLKRGRKYGSKRRYSKRRR